MKKNKQHYKRIFAVLIIVFGLATIYAMKAKETPRFILFFGRFHPLLLHLPIGALVVTFFLDVLGRIQKNYPYATVKNLLGFTAFFSIATCFLGYFLSLEGGYLEQTLNLHLYIGIATAILTSWLFLISIKDSFKADKMFFPLFVVTLITMSMAGHYGSVLTHGDNFLTEYAVAKKKKKTIETIDSLRLYSNVISKILDDKCVQCHNTTKRKGKLSLISRADILKGGENGLPFVTGNAHKSLLYKQLMLPISNEDHMPPEGKEQLTKDEIWLIKHWIDQGLDFENKVTNTAENDTLRKLLRKYLVFNKVEIAKASKSDIEDLRTAGFRVLELVPGKAELNVKYLKSVPTKGDIDELSLLKEQIIELDFSNSELTDNMTSVIKKFKNLKTLRINSRLITDKAIKNFKKLKNLEVLNVYNTGITNEGLKELLGSIQPKQIYSWQTKVDRETANQLAKKYQINIQNNIQKGFVVMSKLDAPLITPERTLFTDTIGITIKSRLKDVDLRYTLNGATPDTTSTIFTDKIILDNSTTLKIATFKKEWLPSEILTREYVKVKHQVSNFSIKEEPNEGYANTRKLFDLKEGSLSFKDGEWTGFFGYDLNTTIDLGAVKKVSNITFTCLEDVASWILFPKKLTVFVSDSKTGSYKELGKVTITRKGQGGEAEIKKVTLQLPETSGRYFKIAIENHKILPKWHPSAGNKAWLFVDEIYFW
ncbi:MAG: chitobiase/beta-hexosaminidase C-terminal domain-containing protein [Flavobacteriaceae bacterium]